MLIPFAGLKNKVKNKTRNIDAFASTDRREQQLQQLIDKKARLLVKAEDCQSVFQSMLLSTDVHNQTLTIDELFPQADISFQSDVPLYFEFHETGKTVSFNSELITPTRAHGLPALLVQYPDVVESDQRRNNFRISLDPTQTVSAKLFQNSYENYFGIVKDISNHGLRINLSGNQSEYIEHGDVIPSCVIKLDDINQIECQLTVRSKRYYSRPYRFTQIGTEITGIHLKHRHLLTNYVSRQQRLQCREKAASLL